MAGLLTLKTAIGTYPHTRPLKDGTVTSPRLCLDHVEVVPANRAFRPMVNQLAFDVSELALVTLLLARAMDRPLVGVPVVLMQQTAYGMLLVPQDSPLRDPRQLAAARSACAPIPRPPASGCAACCTISSAWTPTACSWVTMETAHVDGFVDPPNARPAPQRRHPG